MAHARKIAVIGLGYVGLPVAVGFARTGANVIGFDIDAGRIAEIAAGNDRTAKSHPRSCAPRGRAGLPILPTCGRRTFSSSPSQHRSMTVFVPI